ncbi:hypothetical protein [Bacillus bombysepticus]|uniref:hypothetical protein n=1 Tax=Bacillus bombysepticus TaxID=658666 RepID=UPI00301AAA48
MRKTLISLLLFFVYASPFTYLMVSQSSMYGLIYTFIALFLQSTVMTYFAMFSVKKTVPIMIAGYTVSMLITAYLLYGLNVVVGSGMESYFSPLSPEQAVWSLYAVHLTLSSIMVRLAKKHIRKLEGKKQNGETSIEIVIEKQI